MTTGRLAILTALGVLLIAGCGDGESGGATPSASGTPAPTTQPVAPTPSAPPTGSTPTSAPADDAPIPKDPIDGQMVRGLSAAETDEERAVEEVWYAYWTQRFEMYRAGEPDRDAVYALADGTAASGPLQYVAEMQEAGHTQRGGAIVAVTRLDVEGRTATVVGCLRNSTQDVDADGIPVEQVDIFLTTKDTLRRTGADWRVVEQLITSRSVPCDYR